MRGAAMKVVAFELRGKTLKKKKPQESYVLMLV